jgi:hypothetical protein
MIVTNRVAAQDCTGDCGADGEVLVNELIVGVSVALGTVRVEVCRAADADGDETVSIAELVVAVNNALQGCGPTPTPTSGGPTATPTVTPTLAIGPVITFFGITSADDTLQPPTATQPPDVPIFERPFGFSFSLVVEARRGSSRCGQTQQACPAGQSSFAPGDAPDLQVQVTRPLGDGSDTVCDDGSGDPPIFGGVPGIDPPRLEEPGAIADALNDLGCRFIDGAGQRVARACAMQACVRFEDGEYDCVDDTTEVQFCAPIPQPLAFPAGDTLVTARLRDVGGNLGPPARLIVRVVP